MIKKNDEFFKGKGLVAALVVCGVLIPILFQGIGGIIIGTIIVVIGICGLGIELDKLYNSGYTNIFLGLGFILLGILAIFLFPNVLTKIFFLLTSLFGVFGFISGITELFTLKKNNSQKIINDHILKTKSKNIFNLIISIIVGFTGFIANIFQILEYVSKLK